MKTLNIHKYQNQIETLNNRDATGYDETLGFNRGYTRALLINKLINKKEFNILKTVFGNKNINCDYFISNDGKLGRYKDEE